MGRLFACQNRESIGNIKGTFCLCCPIIKI
nr:MAG TPA: conotoxin [Caudoviricetes sp.]DAW48694.1 MAG TPA: conotoxin [Caudoviricetes sp.]